MRRNGVKAQLHLVIVVLVLTVAACGDTGADVGQEETTDDSVTCSANINDVSFSPRYLEGPELDRSELLDTSAGQVLEALFVGGDAEGEGGQFRESDGFSIVSEELVLGYKGGAVTWFFSMDDGGVRSWGGCNPTHSRGNQVTARWTPTGHVSTEDTEFPIYVEGGACTTDNGREVITTIESIVVEEELDQVNVTVWTSDRSLDVGFCAGVGINIDARVTLTEPLGNRTLMDAGVVPPILHDNPHQIAGTWATFQCGSDLIRSSVADYYADTVGAATTQEALNGFPLTLDPRFEHFLMDDTETSVVYGYSNEAAYFVATVTLININDSWLIGSTEQCGELP